jgi:hypothetical protein
MLRASLFDVDTYEEVEADPSSIRQAALVVTLAAASNALGTWIQGAGAGIARPRSASRC